MVDCLDAFWTDEYSDLVKSSYECFGWIRKYLRAVQSLLLTASRSSFRILALSDPSCINLLRAAAPRRLGGRDSEQLDACRVAVEIGKRCLVVSL